jgi:hypothetical protein
MAVVLTNDTCNEAIFEFDSVEEPVEKAHELARRSYRCASVVIGKGSKARTVTLKR